MTSLRALLARGPQPSPHPLPNTKARRAAPIYAHTAVVAYLQKVWKKTNKSHLHPRLLKPPRDIVRPKGRASRSATAATSSAASTAQQQTIPKSHSTPQYPKRSLITSHTNDVSTILPSEPKKKPRPQLPRPIRRSAATADNAKGSATVSPGRMLPASPPGISPNFKGVRFHSQTQPMPHTQTKPSKCKTQPKPSTKTQHVQRGRGANYARTSKEDLRSRLIPQRLAITIAMFSTRMMMMMTMIKKWKSLRYLENLENRRSTRPSP